MTEADWQPLRALGFDDRACLEVVHVVGIFNYLTRLADGTGLRLDDETKKASESGIALQHPVKDASGRGGPAIPLSERGR